MSVFINVSDYNAQYSYFKKHYESGMMGNLKTANDLISQAKSMLLVKNLSSFNLLMDRAEYYANMSHDEFQYAMEHHYQGLVGDGLAEVNVFIDTYIKTLDKYEADYAALLAQAESHDSNQEKEDNTGGGIPVQNGNNELKDEDYSEDDDKASDKKDSDTGGEWIPGIKNEYVIYGGFGLLCLLLIKR